MERRTFLKWLTHGLGALFGLIIGIPAVAYLLDPLRRKARSGDFKIMARLSELEPGVPKQFAPRDVRRDAWTLHPNDVIGRVWLVRDTDQQDQVLAFTTICPHLGCSVNFQAAGGRFVCPCHNGTFYGPGPKCGERVSEAEMGGVTNPAPRGMDTLEIDMAKDPASPDPAKPDLLIQVKYQNFIQGREDKVPKT